MATERGCASSTGPPSGLLPAEPDLEVSLSPFLHDLFSLTYRGVSSLGTFTGGHPLHSQISRTGWAMGPTLSYCSHCWKNNSSCSVLTSQMEQTPQEQNSKPSYTASWNQSRSERALWKFTQ